MAAKRDFYEVLGVARSSSEGEIAAAYRKLAIKFHPDKNPGDAEAVNSFKEAAEAFEVLGNTEKRARYDRFGHAGVEGGSHFADVNDIFAAFGDIFGDGLFGDLFGRGGRRGARAHAGGDVRCDVTLDLLEAARGCTKKLQFEREHVCGQCQGSGAKPGTRPESCAYCGGHGQVIQATGIFRVQTTCPSCRGAGSVIKERCSECGGAGVQVKRVHREVTIPAGVDTESRLRLTGEGNPSRSGGPPGDCYCFIAVREHALFQRQGQHLICQVPVTYCQAALGATIEVPTLDGREDLKVPQGTQPGDIFKLRGRGMPDLRRKGRGDLVVQVVLEVPKSVSPPEERLLRELAELEQANVSPHRKSFFEKLKDYFLPESDPAGSAE